MTMLAFHQTQRLCHAISDGVRTCRRIFSSNAVGGESGSQRWGSAIAALTDIMGAAGVVQDGHDLEKYNADWLGKYKGQAKVALQPQTTDQVAKILKYCNANGLPVVTQGGNTGVVGGSVPIRDEIVLSMTKMKKIREFDVVSGTVVVEAGMTLQQELSKFQGAAHSLEGFVQELDEFLLPNGYTAPLDLGAKGSCQIGGNVSTAAGGVRYLRYGSLHNSVIGLEVVLADGTVLDMLTRCAKDNTGYHLHHMFIGAEGTLGVVTAVAFRVPPKSTSCQVVMVGLSDWQKVLEFMRRSRQSLAEVLSAFEVIDDSSIDLVRSVFPAETNAVLPEGSSLAQNKFYVLLEASGSNGKHDKEKLECLLQEASEAEVINDGIFCQTETQKKDVWRVRELLPESLLKSGLHWHMFDITLPAEDFYSPVLSVRDAFKERCSLVTGFGHIFDGNLHLNILSKENESLALDLEKAVYQQMRDIKGSISAEHGIGQMKRESLFRTKSPKAIEKMVELKKVFDPESILNPGKSYARGFQS